MLALLKKKYGIKEEDFISAELEIVPAGKARNCGIDESMIMAYGQDDRVCAYTSMVAMLEAEDVEKTTCCLLTDKEEIGSVGATGMQSHFFENTVAEIMNAMGCYNELASEDVWHPPECYPLTYLQVMIQPLQVHLTRRMRLSLVKVWYLTSLQEQEANPVPMMQMQSILQLFVR